MQVTITTLRARAAALFLLALFCLANAGFEKGTNTTDQSIYIHGVIGAKNESNLQSYRYQKQQQTKKGNDKYSHEVRALLRVEPQTIVQSIKHNAMLKDDARVDLQVVSKDTQVFVVDGVEVSFDDDSLEPIDVYSTGNERVDGDDDDEDKYGEYGDEDGGDARRTTGLYADVDDADIVYRDSYTGGIGNPSSNNQKQIHAMNANGSEKGNNSKDGQPTIFQVKKEAINGYKRVSDIDRILVSKLDGRLMDAIVIKKDGEIVELMPVDGSGGDENESNSDAIQAAAATGTSDANSDIIAASGTSALFTTVHLEDMDESRVDSLDFDNLYPPTGSHAVDDDDGADDGDLLDGLDQGDDNDADADDGQGNRRRHLRSSRTGNAMTKFVKDIKVAAAIRNQAAGSQHVGSHDGDASSASSTSSTGDRQLQASCNGKYQVIRMAIRYDSGFCAMNDDSPAKAKAHVERLVALVSSWYEVAGMCKKVAICDLQGHCNGRSGTDQYRQMISNAGGVCSKPGYLLERFTSHMFPLGRFPGNLKYKSGKCDVVHLLYGNDKNNQRPHRGGTVGCAYIGVACNGYSTGVNNVGFSSSTGMQAALLTHELGHNLGARHASHTSRTVMRPSVCECPRFDVQTLFSINKFVNNRDTRTCIGRSIIRIPAPRSTPAPVPSPKNQPAEPRTGTRCANTRWRRQCARRSRCQWNLSASRCEEKQ